jgi:hypothetical protein
MESYMATIETDEDLLNLLYSLGASQKPPEFRLYYDENGKVIHYTCEDLAGNYIVVDSQIYNEGRYDVRVIDGKIVNTSEFIYTQKMIPSTIGSRCAKENVNILVSEHYAGETITWDVKQYEHKNS